MQFDTMKLFLRGVILTGAVLQAKGRISHAAYPFLASFARSGNFFQFYQFYGTVNVIVWLFVSLPDVPVTVMV